MVSALVIGFTVATLIVYLIGYLKNPNNVQEAFNNTLQSLFHPSQGFAYIIIAAFLLSSMLAILIPKEMIAQWLGREAGIKGILIGTAMGAITPGGPFLVFPIILGLYKAGASMGSVVAYFSSWALIAVHRIITWEIPLMGIQFTASRIVLSVAIPIILGAVSQWVYDILF